MGGACQEQGEEEVGCHDTHRLATRVAPMRRRRREAVMRKRRRRCVSEEEEEEEEMCL